jgi:hypothetical protein
LVKANTSYRQICGDMSILFTSLEIDASMVPFDFDDLLFDITELLTLLYFNTYIDGKCDFHIRDIWLKQT